ncbi:BrnT family toxin [Aurantimonas sp. Leaf443]|uniref:BrnT family toxin n=1 Tax=Aurantimonas sp. Leaf443 TaxID=1736378 RepID=UPI0006FA00B9|nr:BrnT family toxin [Aurantimonas sp. Leaf443]KQT85924.1 hypothetical protein ASG48_04805 [Aurantimonas sp. Leaf443]
MAIGFEWDERKRASNERKHGVDLLRAARIFEGEVLEAPDRRRDYGEPRFIAIGLVGDDCFVLVWTPRNGRRRLISAWKGGRDERQIHQDRVSGRNPRDG